jgi:hypothetical protein
MLHCFVVAGVPHCVLDAEDLTDYPMPTGKQQRSAASC